MAHKPYRGPHDVRRLTPGCHQGLKALHTWLIDEETIRRQYEFHKMMLLWYGKHQQIRPDLLHAPQEVGKTQQWILNGPGHLDHLHILLDIYPDARIIWTHRNVFETIIARMEELRANEDQEMANYVSRRNDIDVQLYAHLRSRSEKAIAVIDQTKRQGSAAQFQDVYYEDLMADPIATVKSIYAGFGMIEPSQEHVENMQDWWSKHYRAPNSYEEQKKKPTELGVPPVDALNDMLAKYVDRFPRAKGK